MRPRPGARKPRVVAKLTATRKRSVAALADETASSKTPNPDKLKYLRGKIAEIRDLDAKIADTEAALDDLRKTHWRAESEELPALFEELGISSLAIDPEGNLPGYVAKLATQYKAALPKDERAQQAFKRFRWLGELAKRTYTIFLGREDEKKAKALEKLLKGAKVNFEVKTSVNASTLTAEIRRRFEGGQPLPPADLDLLGAFIRQLVQIDEQKVKV